MRPALTVTVISVCAIAGVYASAWLPGGTPPQAGFLMIAAVPTLMVSIMALGAARRGRLGILAYVMAAVWLLLVSGFSAALLLPAESAAQPMLWLGLPRRAAIVLYGIGIIPLVFVPLAYAMTFDHATLSEADLSALRAAAADIIATEKAQGAGDAA